MTEKGSDSTMSKEYKSRAVAEAAEIQELLKENRENGNKMTKEEIYEEAKSIAENIESEFTQSSKEVVTETKTAPEILPQTPKTFESILLCSVGGFVLGSILMSILFMIRIRKISSKYEIQIEKIKKECEIKVNEARKALDRMLIIASQK